MADRIQNRRGTKANLPVLSPGEIGLCTDTGEVYIGNNDGINIPVNQVYSKTAVIIGNWIDGKPIYRTAWSFTGKEFNQQSFYTSLEDLPNAPVSDLEQRKGVVRSCFNMRDSVMARDFSTSDYNALAKENTRLNFDDSAVIYCVVEYTK